MGAFFQYKDAIYAKFQNQIEEMVRVFWEVVGAIEEMVPKYNSRA